VSGSRPVYSTDGGRISAAKSAPSVGTAPAGDGIVRISRDKSGRRGKVVTVVRGLPGSALDARAGELRRLCGAGGTIRVGGTGVMEIQGDHRDRVAEHLRGLGYTVKLAGG
jgi:translation initiation factor 1